MALLRVLNFLRIFEAKTLFENHDIWGHRLKFIKGIFDSAFGYDLGKTFVTSMFQNTNLE